MSLSAPSSRRSSAPRSIVMGVGVLLAVVACLAIGVWGALLVHKLGYRPVGLTR